MSPALAAILAGDGVPGKGQVDLFPLATVAAGDLLDADAQRTLAHRWVRLARDLGDGQALAAALGAMACTEILAGRLDEAEVCLGEGRALGPHWGAERSSRGVELTIMAWRGLEEEAHAAARRMLAGLLPGGAGGPGPCVREISPGRGPDSGHLPGGPGRLRHAGASRPGRGGGEDGRSGARRLRARPTGAACVRRPDAARPGVAHPRPSATER